MPGRQGSSILLTSELADEVMVTGDIHGHRRNFNRLRRIAALDKNPRRHLVLQEVCHGGPCYANGGCMSHALLEDVAELIVAHPQQVHLILGNHELAELTDFPIRKNNQLLNLMFRLGLRHMYGPAEDDVRQAIGRFLWTCPLTVRLPQGVFIAHSLPEFVDSRRGFDPSVLLRDPISEDGVDGCDVFRLVWGRDYRIENAKAFCEVVGAKLLITGHEPCRDGFLAPNEFQIILDCCGEKAAYAMLPVGVELTHAEVVRRIALLEE